MTFATSPLAQNGLVIFCWSPSLTCFDDADADGVPDAADQCRVSDRNPTVVMDGCESGVGNDLDVDGCTIADRMAALAAEAPTHGQFVRDVAQLTRQLEQQGLITRGEQVALRRCSAQAELP